MCECVRRIAKHGPLGSFPWLPSEMFGLGAGRRKDRQAGPGRLLTKYTYQIRTKSFFFVGQKGKKKTSHRCKSTGDCRERAQAVRKHFPNTHTHTGQKESWLYVTDKQIH